MKAADQDLLSAFYAEHASALLRYVLRLTAGDRGRAEDIVQETFVRAWQNPQVLDASRGPVRPWLFTVARRIAIDDYRRRESRPHEVGGEQGDNALRTIAGDGDLEAGLDRIVLLEALSALSAEHREVLVHTYYAGKTVVEAAAALQIPIGTVKSRTFYALKALRLALTERGVRT